MGSLRQGCREATGPGALRQCPLEKGSRSGASLIPAPSTRLCSSTTRRESPRRTHPVVLDVPASRAANQYLLIISDPIASTVMAEANGLSQPGITWPKVMGQACPPSRWSLQHHYGVPQRPLQTETQLYGETACLASSGQARATACWPRSLLPVLSPSATQARDADGRVAHATCAKTARHGRPSSPRGHVLGSL